MDHETRSEHYAGGFPNSIEAFSSLSDPRTGRNKRHYFGEVLFIALAAMICQCEGFDDIWSDLARARNHGCESISSIEPKNQSCGRQEKRIALASDALDWIDKNERESWFGLKSLVCVESHRKELRAEKTSVERRYYLTSRKPDAEKLQPLIRQHWAIENSCHWILDVVYNEEASRIRKQNAAENVALLHKIALNLLQAGTQ